MDLDKVFRELGYSNKFKDICNLKKNGFINTSGYQLEGYRKTLDRLNIGYRVLDIGYGFKIELMEGL